MTTIYFFHSRLMNQRFDAFLFLLDLLFAIGFQKDIFFSMMVMNDLKRSYSIGSGLGVQDLGDNFVMNESVQYRWNSTMRPKKVSSQFKL